MNRYVLVLAFSIAGTCYAQIGGNPLTGGGGGTGCTTGTSTVVQKGDGSGGCAPAVANTDYAPVNNATFTGNTVANLFTGPLTGNVTGNVSGSSATAGTAAALTCGTLLGDLPYFNTTSTMACLPGSITSTVKILTQTGNGTISAAPAWSAVTGTGTPVLSASPTVTGTWNMGAISMTGNVTSPRWVSSGTAPTIAVGAGAGTGATASILAGSTNAVGQLTVTSGTVPAPATVVATVTFNGTVSPAPRAVYLFPVNATAALDTLQVFSSIPSTTTWTINAGATGLTASLAHTYFYLVL